MLRCSPNPVPGGVNPPWSNFLHLPPLQQSANLPRLGFCLLLPSDGPRGRAMHVPSSQSPQGAMATPVMKAQVCLAAPQGSPPARGISPLCRDGVRRFNQFPLCCTHWAGHGEGTVMGWRRTAAQSLPPHRQEGLQRRSCGLRLHRPLYRKGPDVSFAGWSTALPSPFFPPGESRPLIQAKEVDGGKTFTSASLEGSQD